MPEENPQELQKKCFVIMPIAELESYGQGHFARVYDYIIKPACLEAGFIPVRADEVKQTNMIVLDILQKIIEFDMVICDLSSRNANVFYELGIRQAFSLPAVLMKDKRTLRAFDIAHMRDYEYDESLRVDSVQSDVSNISELIRNTYNSHINGDTHVNSLVSLLGTTAPKINSQVSLTDETKLILESIRDIGERISSVEDKIYNSTSRNYGRLERIIPGEIVESSANISARSLNNLEIVSSLQNSKFNTTPLGKYIEKNKNSQITNNEKTPTPSVTNKP
ncbi:hypothetical protein [Paenibacillus albus]|uniref:Nucleoside 2-deoxyribosyltransferase n=1 Tax=Paenibacillus albus TaxID=2495582 RepID=A0A3Q8X9E0_9BACL|nr:hypothetical protein [Paenibacillus albus]AZN43369.1 hypothetical protein EJC50_29510 [Paenibacillus albus]